MAKQEKEVEKWVTVNGARVPIFKDGSIGGPKALRDKVKASQDKRTDKKETKSFVVDFDIQKAIDKKEARRAKSHEAYMKKKQRDTEAVKKAFEAGEDTPRSKAEAKALLDKYKDNNTKEKQIAKNKAEADKLNGKPEVSDRVKAYQDKFLKKRSVEEIKEIQRNIEKGSKGIPMSSYDMVAMRAIEHELKERNGKKGTKANERTANQTREEELKSKIKQLEKNAFNKDARVVLGELRARADEHRRFESDREDMQARLKSLKAKEKELTKTSAFKPEARQTLKELRARIEEIQLMERNDAHELISYKRKK